MAHKGDHYEVWEVVKVQVNNLSNLALEKVEETKSFPSEAGHILTGSSFAKLDCFIVLLAGPVCITRESEYQLVMRDEDRDWNL